MAYKHRVTLRVSPLEGPHGVLTWTNEISANTPSDITIPITDLLDRMLQVDAVDKQTPKRKRK